MPRKKSLNSPKNYFDVEEEQAVVDYLFGDPEKREQVFNDKLNAPLNKMIEALIKRYGLFRKDISTEDLIADTLSFLLTKFSKFQPDRNKKAFSYYGTISVNYLKGQLLKYSINEKRYLSYEDLSTDLEENNNLSYEIRTEEHVETYDFIPIIIKKMEDELKTNEKLKPNDIKVGRAIIELLENWEIFIDPKDESNILNRNKVLYFLRETTFLKAKDVSNSLKKFKLLYNLLKTDTYEID